MRHMIAILLFAATTSAVASDWVLVSAGSGVSAYVDNESIRFQGSNAKVWVKWVYEKPQKIEGTYPDKYFVLGKELSVYKCLDRTSGTVQSVKYSSLEAGEVVESYSIAEKYWSFSEVVPDTMGETILSVVCKKRPKSK